MNTEEAIARLDRALPVLMSRVVHRTRIAGVGPAAMMVMRKLKHAGSCTVSELAEWMGVTSATVTGITNKLAAQDLITRTRDTADRRVVHIHLTEKAANVLKEIEQVRREALARILSKLTQEDQRKLVEIIEKLVDLPED